MSRYGLAMGLVCTLLCLATSGGQKVKGKKPTTPAFSANETLCLAKRQVLYKRDGKCYDLQQKGPCTSGQWLVLDLEQAVNGTGALEPVCKVCPCCDRAFSIYWPADQRCHKVVEKATLCPQPGTELLSDPFGEGDCVCRREPPHLPLQEHVSRPAGNAGAGGSPACYPLYARGPCPRRSILVAGVLEGYGRVGRCERDPCFSTNERSTNQSYALHAATGMCYPLETAGPCTDNKLFKVNQVTFMPECTVSSNSIFQLPERCKTDMSGDCQVEINLDKDENKVYAQELLTSAGRKRRRTRNSL